MQISTIVISGAPISKARPRFTGKTAYDSQKKAKEYQIIEVMSQKDSWVYHEGALFMSCLFKMPIPKSLSRKKRELFSESHHSSRPDIDNMVKWVMDLLNGVAFRDDAQISILESQKIYHEEPSTFIKIFELESTGSGTDTTDTTDTTYKK